MEISILTKPLERMKEASLESKRREVIRRSQWAVNVAEYNGQLHICVDGVPVLPFSGLGITYEELPILLEKGRKAWADFMIENR